MILVTIHISSMILWNIRWQIHHLFAVNVLLLNLCLCVCVICVQVCANAQTVYFALCTFLRLMLTSLFLACENQLVLAGAFSLFVPFVLWKESSQPSCVGDVLFFQVALRHWIGKHLFSRTWRSCRVCIQCKWKASFVTIYRMYIFFPLLYLSSCRSV